MVLIKIAHRLGWRIKDLYIYSLDASHFFNGSIDDIRIYNCALSDRRYRFYTLESQPFDQFYPFKSWIAMSLQYPAMVRMLFFKRRTVPFGQWELMNTVNSETAPPPTATRQASLRMEM